MTIEEEHLAHLVCAEINKLSLGYEFEMSDYASSKEQEKEYEKKGKAQVRRVAKEITKHARRFAASQVERIYVPRVPRLSEERDSGLYPRASSFIQGVNMLADGIEINKKNVINELLEGL